MKQSKIILFLVLTVLAMSCSQDDYSRPVERIGGVYHFDDQYGLYPLTAAVDIAKGSVTAPDYFFVNFANPPASSDTAHSYAALSDNAIFVTGSFSNLNEPADFTFYATSINVKPYKVVFQQNAYSETAAYTYIPVQNYVVDSVSKIFRFSDNQVNCAYFMAIKF